MISATENSNKFQKTRFWKEKSVTEDVITLGPMAQATLVYMDHILYISWSVHLVGNFAREQMKIL